MDAERVPLSRERVLREAVMLADEDGIGGVTMRRLAQRLGVEAMSLYNHVENKDDLLDGMAEMVSAELAVPSPHEPWRQALQRTATSAREALVRHPWAGVLLESRSTLGPHRLRYLDGVLALLIRAGFPIQSAYHAFLTLDSYIYGFALQEASRPAPAAQAAASAEAFLTRLAEDTYPHVASMARLVMAPEHDPSGDFEFGLTLILDGLERRRTHPDDG